MNQAIDQIKAALLQGMTIERMVIEDGANVMALADDSVIPSFKHKDGTERFDLGAGESVIYLDRGTFLKVKFPQ